MIALLLALAPEVGAAPKASLMVGVWTCEDAVRGEAFGWRVTDDAPSGFLIGEGYTGERRTSLEAWAYDEAGRLGVRRQVADGGVFLEMTPTGNGEGPLVSTGRALLPGGAVVRLRHTLAVDGPDRLKVVWEADEGEGLTLYADEVCVRTPEGPPPGD